MKPWEYDRMRAEEDIANLRQAYDNALAQIEGLKQKDEDWRQSMESANRLIKKQAAELAAAKRDAELCLPVVGYEGAYEVSSIGRVSGVDRTDSDGNRRSGR